METINGVKNWASILDENTRLQAEMLARSEVIAGHVALMPDAHLGKGATVGSVIPTKDAVIPAAVGVDIGCGMIAVRTDIARETLPGDLTELHDQIARSIKSGWGARGQWGEPREAGMKWMAKDPPSVRVTPKLLATALKQLGTMGSGNHFLEMCRDEQDRIWVVIHSGSRGVGNQLANQHLKVAQTQCGAAGIVLEDRDLAFVREGTSPFDEYIVDMEWAQRYALANREIMMDAALGQIFRFVASGTEQERINCHHNFTQREVHYGREVWLTRKGAIFAGAGIRGIVPGSMATGTCITRGLGNAESYFSSAHGAGRQMSRGQAKKELQLDGVSGLYALMQDITWNVQDAKELLDEHPFAYKDLFQVMEDQRDLCVIEHRLHPVLNYKGP